METSDVITKGGSEDQRHDVGEDCKAKLKGEKKIAEKVKELEIFQAQKEREVAEKFSRASKSNLLTKGADISWRDLMNSHPQCPPEKVEVRHQKDRKVPGGGEEMLEEIMFTQHQPERACEASQCSRRQLT